jgi:hypothetical protein
MKPERISLGNNESINSLSTRYNLEKKENIFTVKSGKIDKILEHIMRNY